jgi:hypothetical protein
MQCLHTSHALAPRAQASGRARPRHRSTPRGIRRSVGATHDKKVRLRTRATEEETSVKGDSNIADAMAAARACEASGLSPGAGLGGAGIDDAEAQAEAAFADMVGLALFTHVVLPKLFLQKHQDDSLIRQPVWSIAYVTLPPRVTTLVGRTVKHAS